MNEKCKSIFNRYTKISLLILAEWDSEIEEFLPAVTEDNLQVLKRAGESGDHSLTPTSLSVENNIGIILYVMVYKNTEILFS